MNSQCFICGEDNPNRLETHHVVPRRFGGADSDENLARLCAGCHSAIEKLYNKRFYDRLGVKPESQQRPDDVDEAMANIETYGVPEHKLQTIRAEGYELGDRVKDYETWEPPKIAEEMCWLIVQKGQPLDEAHRRVRARVIEQAGITEERFRELGEYAKMRQPEGEP